MPNDQGTAVAEETIAFACRIQSAIAGWIRALSTQRIMGERYSGQQELKMQQLKIFVPVDSSTTSTRGLEEAIRLARLTRGRLRLVHVLDQLSFELDEEMSGEAHAEGLDRLKARSMDLLDRARSKAIDADADVDVVLAEGTASIVHKVLADQAAAWQADVIVLGTNGRRGLRRWVLGSTADKLFHCTSVPILLIKDPEASDDAI
jgi:nucleotide-binding universal stress UspA family protein